MFICENNGLHDYDDDFMSSAKTALENIKNSKEYKNQNVLNEISTNLERFDRGKYYFDEFDQIAYETKVKIDGLYINQLLQKLEEGHIEHVQKIFESLYKDVCAIYEHVNIKPDVYGKSIDSDILTDSIESAHQKLSKVIYEFINNNFYKLDPNARKDKYFHESNEIAKILISEGNDVNSSIAYSVKVVVMENLLRNITFPFGSWARVSYLSEDENYGKVFDQDKLIQLKESFESKLHSIAKIVATCV